MVGIIVQLLLSWLFIWLFERSNLSVLGLRPSRKRLFDFVLFMMISGLLCSTGYFLKMIIAGQRWQLNPAFEISVVAEGLWWNIKSVLFEELIFRGVLFYVLIRKLRVRRAILISSTAFGVYHWFSHNSLGNPQAMAVEFVITGAMGVVLAVGYARTWSLYIPIAIHLGWNVVQQTAFSNGPIGNQIFTEVMPRPIVTVSYFTHFFVQLFPLVSVLAVNFWLIIRKEQMERSV